MLTIIYRAHTTSRISCRVASHVTAKDTTSQSRASDSPDLVGDSKGKVALARSPRRLAIVA